MIDVKTGERLCVIAVTRIGMLNSSSAMWPCDSPKGPSGSSSVVSMSPSITISASAGTLSSHGRASRVSRSNGAYRRVVRALRPVLTKAAGVPMPQEPVFEAVEKLHADLVDLREGELPDLISKENQRADDGVADQLAEGGARLRLGHGRGRPLDAVVMPLAIGQLSRRATGGRHHEQMPIHIVVEPGAVGAVVEPLDDGDIESLFDLTLGIE